jgi:hypothetical protein
MPTPQPPDCRGARDPARRRALARIALAAVGASTGPTWLAGCAAPLPESVDIGQGQILAALTAQMPWEQPVGEFIMLRLAQPRLQLQPLENRLRLGFDLNVAERLISRRAYRGAWVIGTALRLDPEAGSLHLSEVRSERLAIDGLPARLGEMLDGWGGRALADRLQNQVVHRFSDAQRDRLRRAGVRAARVEVREEGLRVHLNERTDGRVG